MWLWRWIKKRYQCPDCGGWNKTMLGNLCLDVETCPSWTRGKEILPRKRPVAWRVKDYADGWIIFQDEAAAYREAEATGAPMQGLYVRDGN